MNTTPFAALDRVGLNLHAVLAVATLPEMIGRTLPRKPDGDAYAQLILIGNAGPALWRTIAADPPAPEHPIDTFTIRTTHAWLATHTDTISHRLYPGDAPVGLQALGRLVGWHHASPFMVGIQPVWGTWFAYRAAFLADTQLPHSVPPQVASPCTRCADRACVDACPARAMAGGDFDLARCLAHRLEPDSPCAATCPARLACPVGTEHRYDTAQIHHGYSQSLRMIRAHARMIR